MKQPDHYAVLVTINHYPGLSDLAGPEHDGTAMREWLLDPEGGGLELEHVNLIRSSDFAATNNPDDANPTERELVRALNNWLRVPGGWRERVGGRIYLYFAGHGFTAGTGIGDPALFTAIAQIGDTAHIAGYRYAAKIVNAGFFDEVVLIMDCCQDVLKASQVLEPTWSPPDRNRAADVKFLQAYGAPRGRKAFEEEMAAVGTARGLFSTVWLEAVKSAAVNDNGWVTGAAVKARLLALWREQYRTRTNYDPPVRLPDGDDILLYPRAIAAHQMGNVDHVTAGLEPRGLDVLLNDMAVDINDEMSDLLSAEPSGMDHASPHFSRSGSYRRGRYSDVLSQPQPIMVNFTITDTDLDIVVLDSGGNKVASGAGTLAVPLTPGDYTALVCAPGASSSTLVTVGEQPLSVFLDGPAFASAAPLARTSTTHEYQQCPAVDRSRAALPATAGGAPNGELFLFVRDSREPTIVPPMEAPRLRLVGLGQSYVDELGSAWVVDAKNLYACARIALQGGSYGLVFDDGQDQESAIALTVVSGWRTDVYVDSVLENVEIRVPDLQRATLFLTRVGTETPLCSSEGRAAELARLCFEAGRPVRQPVAGASPLHALFAAYAAATTPNPDAARIRSCLAMLPDDVRAALPDASLLEAFCSWLAQHPLDRDWEDRPPIPLINAGWELMAQLGSTDKAVASAVSFVGQWRLTGSVWTYWQQPAEVANVLRRRIERRERAGRQPAVATELEPPWDLATWKAVAGGLRKPIPSHSPFEQALRRRILDFIEDQCAEDPVPALAKAFGLPRDVAVRSYAQLFAYAKCEAEKV
jgi:hypothetical protein